MTIEPTPANNAAVAAARDMPDLIHRLERADPAAAEQFTGKALVASRTVYGGLATIAITWLVGRFDLGWGADVVSLVAGACVIVGLRICTSAPIASLLTRFHAYPPLATPGSKS
jgi:hypothetical protein